MSALLFTNRKTKTEGEAGAFTRDRFANAQSLGAVFGLAGGMLASLFGASLTAICWFVTDLGAHHALSEMGTALLFMAIPLLIFGGYCMDWMEKNKAKPYSRVARYDDEDDDQ
jgi:hypothetical protein